MSKAFFAYNGPMQTTAAPASIATGATIKTLMQVVPASTGDMTIIQWGISFDGVTAANPPVKCELITTGTVAATVTAYVANDITRWNRVNDIASTVQLGTALSGYTASAEGTITASRNLDLQLVSPTSGYVSQFPPGREPVVAASAICRIRVTASATVNAYCWMVWEE